MDEWLLSYMYLSIRFENYQSFRYYMLHLTQDLFGEWVIVKAWGGINKAGGRILTVPCESRESALLQIEQIKRKRMQRGYEMVLGTENTMQVTPPIPLPIRERDINDKVA